MTAKKEILLLLRNAYPQSLHKGEIFKALDGFSFMPDTISRVCRQMAATGLIERLTGSQAVYLFISEEPQERKEEKIPTNIDITIIKELLEKKKQEEFKNSL